MRTHLDEAGEIALSQITGGGALAVFILALLMLGIYLSN